MWLLLLRIVLAPLLVAAGSAAQRRWGQAIGGRLVGLPLTSLPLLWLLVLSDGRHFAAAAAAATLAGATAQALLTWTYAKAAGRGGPVMATTASIVAFALAAAVLAVLRPTPVAAAALAVVVLSLLLRVWPTPPATHLGDGVTAHPTRRRHTLALRMVLAGTFTLALTTIASPVGPRLAGLVSALPVLSLVLFALTQRDDGAGGAQEFAHGVQRGTFSVITALLVLALVLPTGHVTSAFLGAIGVSVLAQLAVGRVTTHASRNPAGAPVDRGSRLLLGPGA